MLRYFLLFICIPLWIISRAQDRAYIDEMIRSIPAQKEDTAKVNLLTRIGFAIRSNNIKEAEGYAQQAKAIAEKIDYKQGLGDAYRCLGTLQFYKGNYDKAIEFNKLADPIYQELKETKRIALNYNGWGNSLWNKGEHAPALELFYKALKIFEDLKEDKGIAQVYNNIGGVYLDQSNYDAAIKYFKQSLAIKEKLKSKGAISLTLTNLGILYIKKKEYDTSLYYYGRVMEIMKELNDIGGIAHVNGDLGALYLEKGDYPLALSYLFQAVAINDSLDDNGSLAENYNNIGDIYFKQSNLKLAIEYYNKAFAIAKEINARVRMKYTYNALVDVYKAMGDFKTAFYYQTELMHLKDTILNEENSLSVARMKELYESEKKDQEIQLLNKEKQVQDTELQSQRYKMLGLIAIAFLILVVLIILINRYQVKRKANDALHSKNIKLEEANQIIEQNRNEIALKNIEITDSIKYAQRIQSAILVDESIIKKSLPDSFVYYQPKDIVSGDFYWFADVRVMREKGFRGLFIAVADCTGHGVPGAFMSLIGNDLIGNIIHEKKIYQPAEILNHLNTSVKKALQQKQSTDNEFTKDINDGMDISFCCLDTTKNELQYAGANRPIYIVRGTRLFEIKPAKNAIGGNFQKQEPFTNNVIDLQKGDSVYLFTDGITDQFGGDKMKKFSSTRLKEVLTSIQALNMEQQKEEISKALQQWKGNLDQVDDICVIGFRV